jgi:hypothetical protein
LPFPADFEAGEFVIWALLARRDYARPALNDGFREWYLRILDGVDPEVIESGKNLDGGQEADITLHKRDKSREIEDGIAGKMMGLEFVEVKEAPEEVRCRQT